MSVSLSDENTKRVRTFLIMWGAPASGGSAHSDATHADLCVSPLGELHHTVKLVLGQQATGSYYQPLEAQRGHSLYHKPLLQFTGY